jgi:serine/threonine-protein kinase
VAAASGVAWCGWSGGPLPRGAPPSIAVLAFTDLSPQQDQEYLADGVAGEILNALSRIEGLKVIGRSSSFSFKGKSVESAEIGRRLNVTSLLEGSVRRDGNRLRITAELVQAASGSRLWSRNFDRDLGATFSMQEEIAREVAAALRPRLLQPASTPRAPRPEVYTQYLLARQIRDQARTRADLMRATAAFQLLTAMDSGFAPGWASLALLQGNEAFRHPPRSPARLKSLEGAWEASSRAITLAPELGDGYSARAYLRIARDRDWAGALADLEEALRLNPSHVGSMARRGVVLLALGRQAEGLRALWSVVELEPLTAQGWSTLAFALLNAGDLAGARGAATRSAEIEPGTAEAEPLLLLADLAQGQAQRVLDAAARLEDEQQRLFLTTLAEHALGHREAAEASLARFTERFGATEPGEVAKAQAWCGNADQAFAAIERWIEQDLARPGGYVAVLRADQLLGSLHADPRWKDALRRLNLPID